MPKTENLQFRKGDLMAIAIVILLAVVVLLCFLPGKEASAGRAVIYLNGEAVKTVDLSQDQTFTISDRYHNVIQILDGEIRILESDCPGKDCVHSGGIHTAGRILVCLPNALEIRVISDDADVDFGVG